MLVAVVVERKMVFQALDHLAVQAVVDKVVVVIAIL
jgi:hypothetical protein